MVRIGLVAALLAGYSVSVGAAPKVLICAADANNAVADIQTKLSASMAFAKVDALDCSALTPALKQLSAYDAVLTFSDIAYKDRVGLGDTLADYVDAGGGVVQMMFAMSSGFNIELQGRWANDGYNCITDGKVLYQVSAFRAHPNDLNSPIVQGVTGIGSQYRTNSALNVQRGAASLWDYEDGAPAVCAMSLNGHPRVDLNFYPGPPPMFYTESQPGDGATLMKNALLFVAHGFNPLTGTPNPVSFPDTGTFAVSNAVTVTYTNSSMATQTATALLLGGANPADFQVAQSPALPQALAPGATLSIDVTFSPLTAGARAATLQLSVAHQTSTADVALSGRAVASQLAVTPNPFLVGGTQIGQTVSKDITVVNKGGGKVSVQSAAITSGQASFALSNVPAFPVALAPQTSFTMTVSFTPQMNGSTPGALTLTSTDPNSPTLRVALTGDSGPPAITVDTGTIAFGDINLGAMSSPALVSISNVGFSDLKITDIQLGGMANDYFIDKMMAIGTLSPMQSQSIRVVFAPTATGNRSATLTISSNAGNKTVDLFGNGTAAVLKVTPKALIFTPSHVKSASLPQTVTIANAGTGTLKVMALSVAGMDAASFAQSAGPMAPFGLAANQSATVSLVCTPQRIGTLSATLSVATDLGSPTLALTGAGTSPKIGVVPSPIDLGSAPIGGMATEKAVTLSNSGSDDLHIHFLAIGGQDAADFTSPDAPAIPLTLAAGTSSSFHVFFTPSSAGMETAELDISSDDPVMGMAAIPMHGVGIQSGFSLSPPDAIDFGDEIVEFSSLPRSLTITNSGDGDVMLPSIVISGMNADVFALDRAGPITLAHGKSAIIHVTFTPRAVGSATATLTVSGAQLMPMAVTLSGIGVSPALAVQPATLDFGSVQVGTASAPETVTVTNGGGATLTLDAIASGDSLFAVDTSKTELTLGAGRSTTFAVVYSPIAKVSSIGQIGVTLKGQTKPAATVRASGSGVIPGQRANAARGGCSVGGDSASVPASAPLSLVFFCLVFSGLVFALRLRRRISD